MTTDSLSKPSPSPVARKKPASRWRNKWRALTLLGGWCDTCGAARPFRAAGEVYDAHHDFATKEQAEEDAWRYTQAWPGAAFYLGAFEVEAPDER